MFQDLEKYLARNIVRIIADDAERRVVKTLEVHGEEIPADNASVECRKMCAKVIDRGMIDLDDRQIMTRTKQELSEYTRARSYLQNG